MTLSRTSLDISSLPIDQPLDNLPEHAAGKSEWKYCLGGLLILAVAYGLLQNGQWISGPDSSFYISVARNLALDRGFVFNGGVVGRIPPLWPAVLALGMKVSSSFWFLNLLPMIGMLGAAGSWYWVLRRFAAPSRAMAVVVLSGLIFYCYTAAVQLRTEGLYCLVFSAAVLLALQIAEGKQVWWRLPALMLLCIAMVMTRWAGLVGWCAVGAALLSGRRIGGWQWLALAATLAANVGAFTLTRMVLVDIEPPEPAWEIEQGKKGGPRIPDEDGDGAAKLHSLTTRRGVQGTAASLAEAGKWISSFLWMPLYVGVTNSKIGLATNMLGWFLLALCCLVAWRDARQRRWLWIGAMLYCAGMIFRVKVPNPRYLVPVAPLVVMGIWLGFEYLKASSGNLRWQSLCTVGLKGFLITVAVCNIALWSIDVYINRSARFYERYRAGEVEKLIAAAQYMRANGVQDGQIAVSTLYINLGRERVNGGGLRAMVLLTDRGVRGGPAGCPAEPNDVLLKWAKKYNVKYYLHRLPTSPWRALHFKVRWLQELLTRKKDIPDNPSWVLYELSEDGARRVELPEVREMTRVPGMEGKH